MANIDTELSTIATAIYGKDMRTAIHDAIEKVNDESSATASTVAGLSDSIESVESDISTIEDEIGTLGGDVKCTVYSGSISSGALGEYTFEKTGSIVTFELSFSIPDPPQSGDYFAIPITLPPAFKPKYSGSHTKLFPIVPCPVNTNGEYPYLSMVSNASENTLEFRVYDARSSVIGSLPSSVLFISTGVYTTAEQNTT
jgi:hypothetical protein